MARLPEYHKYNYELTPKMTLFLEELIEELGPFAENIEIDWLPLMDHMSGKTFNCPSFNSSIINENIVIKLGCNRGKISVVVLIHELFHAYGYNNHCNHDLDFFLQELSPKYSHDLLSHGICKDLYGFGDVFLLFNKPIKETFIYKGIVKELLEK